MTPELAVKHIDDIIADPKMCELCRREHRQLKVWVEKQVRREPLALSKATKDTNDLRVECPRCGNYISYKAHYCSNCGQAIKRIRYKRYLTIDGGDLL